jgi:hypothetical protein
LLLVLFVLFYFPEELLTEVRIQSILNLSDMNVKFRSLSMFAVVELQGIVNTKHVGRCMIHRDAKYQRSSSRDSLVIYIKPKAIHSFRKGLLPSVDLCSGSARFDSRPGYRLS